MNTSGYIFAILSSVFFSLYVIPRKLSSQHPVYFSFFMSVGFLVGATILYLAKPLLGFNETISLILLWSVIAGVVWATGFVLFVKSIDIIGLAGSNQWKNLQGPVGVILSLVILNEWTKTNPIITVLAGIAVFLSALFFTISNSKEQAINNLKGVYLATTSGLAFGIVTVINKYVTTNVGVYSQQVVWSLSILISLVFYILSHKELSKNIKTIDIKNICMGLVAGFLYLGASFFMLQSYKYIPASVGFTIIQLNSIWTISIGIFVFKEIDIKKHYKKIFLGFIFSLIGIALLVFAKK